MINFQELTPTEIAAQELIKAARSMGIRSLSNALSNETKVELRNLLDPISYEVDKETFRDCTRKLWPVGYTDQDFDNDWDTFQIEKQIHSISCNENNPS